MLATTDATRQADLRRMKLVATSFLVAAAAVYLVAKANEESGGAWVGYVRAGAEAAMVGALADWFAVTALFRHPLGIPIPHTAIIPRRKDQIGRSLGEFVEGNFLTRDVIVERLEGVGIGRRLGVWLARPDNAARAGSAITDGLRGTVEVLDDRDVQEGIGGFVERRLRTMDVSPLVARAIDASVEGGHLQRLLDAVFKGLGVFLDENQSTLRVRLKRESPWWVPEPIDDRVFNRIFAGIEHFLEDLTAQPDHEVRKAIEQRVLDLAERLRTDPVIIAKAEELKNEVLSHPDVQAWLQSLWGELKRGILDRRRRPRERAAAAARRRAGGGRAADGRGRRAAGQGRRLGGAGRDLRRRALPQRGRRPDRHHGRALGRPRHGPPDRAGRRSRPAVHPHQRHRRRRSRRPRHPRRR